MALHQIEYRCYLDDGLVNSATPAGAVNTALRTVEGELVRLRIEVETDSGLTRRFFLQHRVNSGDWVLTTLSTLPRIEGSDWVTDGEAVGGGADGEVIETARNSASFVISDTDSVVLEWVLRFSQFAVGDLVEFRVLETTSATFGAGGTALGSYDYYATARVIAPARGGTDMSGMNATVAQMEAVGAKARELGADMTLPATSSVDAAKAMTELAKGVLQMSAAGAIENARAAEIAANALNAFHLAGDKTVMVADLLAGAANASSAEMSDLAFAFQAGSAVASMAGLSIKEYTVTLAEMANAGIKGSDAGTSMKSMLMALVSPSDKGKLVMEQLGVSIFDAHGKMMPFKTILAEFETQLSKLNQESRSSALGKIFGSDGIRAAEIVFKNGIKGFEDMEKAVGKEGAAAELASARNKGLMGAVDGLRSALESTLEKGARPFLGTLEGLVRGAGDVLEWIDKLPDGLKATAVGLGVVAAAVGPVVLGLGMLAGSMSNLLTLGTTLFGAQGLLAGAGAAGLGTFLVSALPVVGVIAGVGLAVWGAKTAYENWRKEIAPTTEELREQAKVESKAALAKEKDAESLVALVAQMKKIESVGPPITEQLKQLQDIRNKIALLAPEMVAEYTKEGNAARFVGDMVKYAAEQHQKLQREMIATKRKEFAISAVGKGEQNDARKERIAELESQIAGVGKEQVVSNSGLMGGGVSSYWREVPVKEQAKRIAEYQGELTKLKVEIVDAEKEQHKLISEGARLGKEFYGPGSDLANPPKPTGGGGSAQHFGKEKRDAGASAAARDAERDLEAQRDFATKMKEDIYRLTHGETSYQIHELSLQYEKSLSNPFVSATEKLEWFKRSLKELLQTPIAEIARNKENEAEERAKGLASANLASERIGRATDGVGGGTGFFAIQDRVAQRKALDAVALGMQAVDEATREVTEDFGKWGQGLIAVRDIEAEVGRQWAQIGLEKQGPEAVKRAEWLKGFSEQLKDLDAGGQAEKLRYLNSEFDKMLAETDGIGGRSRYNQALGEAQRGYMIATAKDEVEQMRLQFAQVRDMGENGVEIVQTIDKAQAQAILGFEKMKSVTEGVQGVYRSLFHDIISGSRDAFKNVLSNFKNLVMEMVIEAEAKKAAQATSGFIEHLLGIGSSFGGAKKIDMGVGLPSLAADGGNGLGNSAFLPSGGSRMATAGTAGVNVGAIHVHVSGAMSEGQARQTGTQMAQQILATIDSTRSRFGGSNRG